MFARPAAETTALGLVHPMSKHSSVNLKATCKRHECCSCWITPRAESGVMAVDLLKDLSHWLSLADKVSAADHHKASRALRQAYGHAVKN